MDQKQVTGSTATRVWIPIGAGLFIVALTVSALVVPQLRLLHVLQGLIYLAIIVLGRRNSAWGFGAGFAIALAWNSLQLFITHNFQGGAVAFWSLLTTGEVRRLDTMMVTLGGVGHFILIFGCMAAIVAQGGGHEKWWKFIGGGVLVLAYFALIVKVALPR